jgi:hypothetical protein
MKETALPLLSKQLARVLLRGEGRFIATPVQASHIMILLTSDLKIHRPTPLWHN